MLAGEIGANESRGLPVKKRMLCCSGPQRRRRERGCDEQRGNREERSDCAFLASSPVPGALRMRAFVSWMNIHGCSLTRLLAFFGLVAMGDPVVSEVVGDVKDLHVGKAEVVQALECGANVGAATPGAATAINHDEFVLRS